MLIILACFNGKEKRKKFDSGISGSGSSSRKRSSLNQVFFYKRDFKLDDLFNPFEFEHAKSIMLYFFPTCLSTCYMFVLSAWSRSF